MTTKFRTQKRCRQRPSCASDVSSRCLSAAPKYAAAFILVACQSSLAFAPSESSVLIAPQRNNGRYFRNSDEIDGLAQVTAEASIASQHWSPLTVPSVPSSNSSVNERMPKWLRNIGSSSDAERKISSLRQTMRTSFLTSDEARSLEGAILEAAGGDYKKISGAVDFCSIMLETMEMGAPTLIAGVFHYCACYAAREMGASVSNPSRSDDAKVWAEVRRKYYPRCTEYPYESSQIAKNAAELKKTEIDYASIIAGSKSVPSRPDLMNSANMRSLLLSRAKNWKALAIRGAACLYRLRGLIEVRNAAKDVPLSADEIRMAREALQMYVPLASQLGMHRLKNEIEGAVFQILYPRQYDEVTSLTHQPMVVPVSIGENESMIAIQASSTLHDDMNMVLSGVTEQVSKLLDKDPLFSKYVTNTKITARVKEPFSLWKKMRKLGASSILDVPDALALRIVFEGKKISEDEDDEITRARERALCYYAQHMCTRLFKPINEDRFKDYIAKPKSNGYQSLHYTACTRNNNEEWPFEIQVRSGAMHQVAEFGLAAHWDYKEKNYRGTSDGDVEMQKFKLDDSSAAYLSASHEWQCKHTENNLKTWEADSSRSSQPESMRPFLKALEAAHSNLTRERVFIFLASKNSGDAMSGKILDLPAGACVLDALRESERTLGFATNIRETEGIIHNNNSLTSVTQKLSNGDILTIPMHALNP